MTDPGKSIDAEERPASEAQDGQAVPACRTAAPLPPVSSDDAAGPDPGVAFAPGTAPAGDPDPTPTTLGNVRNTTPVDPWAGHSTHYPTPNESYAYPGQSRTAPRRRRTWPRVLLAAGLTGVLAVTTAAVVYFWPRYPALDFQRLAETARFAPVVPVSSAFSDATANGDRLYFASSDAAGNLGVTAVDAAAARPAWSSTAAGSATRWENMSGLPYGLVVTGRAGSATRVVVLGAERGDLLWDRMLGDDDQILFGRSVAVHADQEAHQLIGLDAGTGSERWRLPDEDDTGVRTLTVTSAADLTGPASGRGRPFSPSLADARLVQINADHSVRIVDINTGTVGKTWQTAAGVDDEVFAHNGRLVVRESGSVQRVVAYDLETGDPALLHTAEQGTRLTELVPCGNDLVCFVKTRAGGEQTVLRRSITGDGGAWESGPITDVARLVPVGDSVMVQARDSTTLLEPSGDTAWTHPGTVARLDSGNMLRFGHVFTGAPIDDSLSGQHLGDPPVELGAIYDVRTETCAWTTSMLGCVTEKDYVTYRFAE